MCVAVPISEGSQPKGILLGGSAGVQYIEPPAAVGPNNDLAAARGEVITLQPIVFTMQSIPGHSAAEEAVLWDVTTRVIDAVYDIQAVLDMVSLLHSALKGGCSRFRKHQSVITYAYPLLHTVYCAPRC
jgi:hypothetical protein